MPSLFSSIPVYRGLKTSRGLATMRDVWSFARWLGDQLGQTVVVDGVEFAKAGSLKTEVPLASTARNLGGFTLVVPVLRFKRTRGLALASDLQQLAAWLQPQIDLLHRNNDARLSLRRKSARLPVPKKGILLREDLLVFIHGAGAAIGFEARADDLSGIRDAGAGIHVSRRVRTAGILVRTQARGAHGKACYAFAADDGDTGYITVRVTTYTHANGSYTETWTASGTIQGIGPGGSFDACAEVDFDTTYDSEFSYGALESVSSDDTLVPWDDVIAAAAAEIDDDGTPLDGWSDSWEQAAWRAASAARSEFIDVSSSTRGTVPGGGEGWNIEAPKIQIENTGDAQLEVEITFTRISDSATVTPDPIIVGPGQTSDWIDTQAAAAGETWNCHITRVGIGGF